MYFTPRKQDQERVEFIASCTEPGTSPNFEAIARLAKARGMFKESRWQADVVLALSRAWMRRTHTHVYRVGSQLKLKRPKV